MSPKRRRDECYREGDIAGLFQQKEVNANTPVSPLVKLLKPSDDRQAAKRLKRTESKCFDEKLKNAILKAQLAEAEEERRKEHAGKPLKKEREEKTKPAGKKGRRGLNEDEKKEENRRTVFVGNVPATLKEKELLRLLALTNSCIQSIRFRSVPNDGAPDAFKYKNAYIVLRNEESIPNVLAKNGVRSEDGEIIRVSSVSYNRDEFSVFARTSTVFVGNLHSNVTETELWDCFEKNLGAVRNVRVIRDAKNFKSKYFGFVQLADKSSVSKAVKTMNGFNLHNRPLHVTKAVRQEDLKQGKGRVESRGKVGKGKLKMERSKIGKNRMKKGLKKGAFKRPDKEAGVTRGSRGARGRR